MKLLSITASAALVASLVSSATVPLNKREPQPWYLDAAPDATPEKREPQPWYLDAAPDATPQKRKASGVEKKRTLTSDNYPFSRLASSQMLSLYAEGSKISRRLHAITVEEHLAHTQMLEDSVFGTMRQDRLRDLSDRGMKLLSFDVKPAMDRVDREHVPQHLEELVEKAINDQERVSLLNYYLLVTGRVPRPASELGWNRTREVPTLLENDEVGFGYALGSQHQHHCANTVADAIDLGKDNINDFWMAHVVHCLSLFKLYALKLEEYYEPVQPLTAAAQARLEDGYEMSDWLNDDGVIIKQGMLLRNPRFSSGMRTMNHQDQCESETKQLDGWVIFLIIEAVLSTLTLVLVLGWKFVRSAAPPAYLTMVGSRPSEEDEKPFLSSE